ncbi:MAG TPA: TadE/TadG family type IV pilus assembly protein [Candidatus Dormibacteraeota bacterium]|jgi:Flp pilus assembly protein TadG|nr:TadE/TadG family type IV pilus assembly protein [Candidatus Dormibacteraeota bacterium]
MSRGRQSGVAVVEFALMGPVLFLLLFGVFDLGKLTQDYTTVAEAARQGARQGAANADPTDSPFGARNASPCPGTQFATSATGQGCLTDAGILETVRRTLSSGAMDPAATLQSNTNAKTCIANATQVALAPNHAWVCISPSEATGTGTDASCSAAKLRLGRDPVAGDLGDRKDEWSAARYRGCFYVQVTVIYAYKPMTALLQGVIGNRIRLVSSSSTLAEY